MIVINNFVDEPKKAIVIKIIYLIALFSFFGCFKEEMLVAKADFSFDAVGGNSNTPAFFSFNNKSTGGETFEWTFEGGQPATSNKFNPDEVKYSQAGNFNVKLKVSNKDGSVSELTKIITIGQGLLANFTHQILINDFAPVEVALTNLSQGATNYSWTFAGGNFASSNSQNPANVIYSNPGNYSINLTITNSLNQTQQKTVTFMVKPALTTSFAISVPPINADYEAPLTINTINNSISATSYLWTAVGATTPSSTAVNPSFVYNTPGNYTIQLTATNTKSTQIVTQNITVLPNTNLSIQSNIKLGINTAQNTVGCFYSTTEKLVYKASEVTATNGLLIDIVYFGLNATFGNNRFIAANDASNFTFTTIPNATTTSFVNKQETCSCGLNITETQFDNMVTDALIQTSTIINQAVSFNNSLIPRIIPFKTQDGRKGFIKLKSFTNDGLNSYITIDVKVQKQP